jgi:hypothetical protein
MTNHFFVYCNRDCVKHIFCKITWSKWNRKVYLIWKVQKITKWNNYPSLSKVVVHHLFLRYKILRGASRNRYETSVGLKMAGQKENRLEIHSVKLVFSSQLSEHCPSNLLSGSTLPHSPLPRVRIQCVRGGGFLASDRQAPAAKSLYGSIIFL